MLYFHNVRGAENNFFDPKQFCFTVLFQLCDRHYYHTVGLIKQTDEVLYSSRELSYEAVYNRAETE